MSELSNNCPRCNSRDTWRENGKTSKGVPFSSLHCRRCRTEVSRTMTTPDNSTYRKTT